MLFEYRLSDGELRRLTEHKYNMAGSSMLDPYFQVFWNYLVKFVPLWCAPNALTLAALLSNALTVGLLIAYSPDARGSPPAYAFVLCAVGLFMYGTLDGLDGKQARRTGSSSPLGELFDHGCDSISMVLVVVSMCIMLQLGNESTLMLFLCFLAMAIFYTSHWQAYCSGVVKFGYVDVTEGQMGVIFFLLVTALFGNQIWSEPIPLLGVEYKYIPILFSVGGTLLAAYNYLSVILVRGGVGRNGSTVAGTSVLSPLLPMTLLILLGVTLYHKSITTVLSDHIVLYVMSVGMCAAKITKKIVLAYMTRSELEILDGSFVGLSLLFINQYFNTFFNEYIVLWICYLYCTLDLLWYMYNVCDQICDHLHIRCFHIPYPPLTSKLSPPTPAAHKTASNTLPHETESVKCTENSKNTLYNGVPDALSNGTKNSLPKNAENSLPNGKNSVPNGAENGWCNGSQEEEKGSQNILHNGVKNSLSNGHSANAQH